jgi:NADPH:quinone reductase-like Zn-dependent oxidoreductase
MRAFVTSAYGVAGLGELTVVDTPIPAADEVLVRVRATSVNPYDWHHLTGEPYIARLIPGGPGPRRPRYPVLGADMAGTVVATGKDVTKFRTGDDVFALLSAGAFAEFVTVRQDQVTAMPSNLTHELAAAMPMAAVTALIALRDVGGIDEGQQVLINGASGGVGTFAVQLARAFGADVVGVCGARNADLVRSLGACDVIDYRSADFTRSERRFDLLLDIAGSRPVLACRRVVVPRGTVVVVGGPPGRWVQPAGHVIAAMASAPWMSQRVAAVDTVNTAIGRAEQHMEALAEFVEAGSIGPVIDRCYPFDEIAMAIDYQVAGHANGKVVVTF